MARRSVRRYARAAALTAAAATALAACLPIAPPSGGGGGGGGGGPSGPPYQASYCGDGVTIPVSAAGYRDWYEGVRNTNTDFAAADGGLPIETGGGKAVWLFADTYVGYVLPDDTLVSGYGFVHNSFVLQEGPCFTPLFGGPHGARTSRVPEPAANEFYWPMGAFASGSTLYVFLQHSAPDPGTICNCQTLGIRIATFSLPNLVLQSPIVTSPAPFSANTYPVFGDSVVTSSGYHYIYGHQNDRQYVARVAVGDNLATASSWTYWNGGTSVIDAQNWTATSLTACAPPVAPGAPGTGGACPMSFDMPTGGPANAVNGPFTSIAVIADPGGNGFLASAKREDLGGDPVYTWWSASPVGPWTLPKIAAPSTPPSSGFAYGGRVFHLPGTNGTAQMTAEYSRNANVTPTHASTYKVVFEPPSSCSTSTPSSATPRSSCT